MNLNGSFATVSLTLTVFDSIGLYPSLPGHRLTVFDIVLTFFLLFNSFQLLNLVNSRSYEHIFCLKVEHVLEDSEWFKMFQTGSNELKRLKKS